MAEENPPRPSSRALLVYLLGAIDHQNERMAALEKELQAHRAAFEEQTRSQKRHRVLAVIVAVMEWRATLIAGSALAAATFSKWWPFPWRK